MPKTYCFIYRIFGETTFHTNFIQANSLDEAENWGVNCLNAKVLSPERVAPYVFQCVPARRSALRNSMNALGYLSVIADENIGGTWD